MVSISLRYLLITTILTHVSGSAIQVSQVTTEEYLGCYSESEESRDFIASPGDYDIKNPSLVDCIIKCGEVYKYAAMQNGDKCLCSNNFTSSRNTDESNCTKRCKGAAAFSCGGKLFNSIYSASQRILGLEILDPGPITLLEPVTIQGRITNGENVTYQFNMGDATLSEPSSEPVVTHIYDMPGSYIVTLIVSNRISGQVTVPFVVEVDEPYGDVKLVCLNAIEVGEFTDCNGTMGRGSRVNSTFGFGDGESELIRLDTSFYSTGTRLPTGNVLQIGSQDSPTGTFILPMTEFRLSGRLTNWEFIASKPGSVKFQIYRPTCLAGEKFCFERHACIPADQECNSYGINKCPSGYVFCFVLSSCVDPTIVDRNSTQKIYASPSVDYQLVHETDHNIQENGHQIIRLPLEERFDLLVGDVVGWLSGGGDISYRDIAGPTGGEFVFTGTTNGLAARTDQPLKVMKEHMISAHFTEPTHFIIRHRYIEPGMYRLQSNITGVTLVTVDYPLTDVTFSMVTLTKTNTTAFFVVSEHPGTNATYVWNFGNDVVLSTQAKNFSYSYPQPGVYKVTLNTQNAISSVIVNNWIQVMDAISSLEFHQPVLPTILGDPTQINWRIFQGTNVTFIVDFGDGSPLFTTDTFTSNTLTQSILHSYSVIGEYTVTISAYSTVGPNVSISATAFVEIVLEDLQAVYDVPPVSMNKYVKFNGELKVTRSLTKGSDIICSVNFGDGSEPTITSESSIGHVYVADGSFRVNITCYNHLNTLTLVLPETVVVQPLKPIDGMRLQARPQVLGLPSSITLTMVEGTVFICDWDLGDGTTRQTDSSHLGSPQTHKFTQTKDFKVVVTCANELGSVTRDVISPVDIPIPDNLNIFSSEEHVKVGQQNEYTALISAGSRVSFLWDFGDKNNLTSGYAVTKDDETIVLEEKVPHVYREPGLFITKVTAFNSVGSVKKSTFYPLMVEYPVSGVILLSNSPVSLEDGVITFTLYLPPGNNPPTDAKVDWDFGDGATSNGDDFYIIPGSSFNQSHRYQGPGVYTAEATMYNTISRVTLSLDIIIQEMKDIVISGRYSKGGQEHSGQGSQNNHFPVSTEIHFRATSQERDISYIWSFGDGSETETVTTPELRHTYNNPGDYMVTVKVINSLKTMEKISQFFIESEVIGLEFNCSYPTYFGDPTEFTFEIGTRGSRTCVVADMDEDGNKYTIGEFYCQPQISESNHFFLYMPETTNSFTFSHTFKSMGVYYPTLTAGNKVSDVIRETLVNISDNPCDYPKVKIIGGGTVNAPFVAKKSMLNIFRSEVNFKCLVADTMYYSWEVFVVSEENPRDQSTILPLNQPTIKQFKLPLEKTSSTKDTQLKIEPRTLPYGLHMFKLTISFKGSRDLTHIYESDSVWIDVVRSPLAAIIKGGSARSAGYEVEWILDGSQTNDPDMPGNKTGITYIWYCKKKSELFPDEEGYVPDPYGGCWGLGTYEVNGTGPVTSVYTGDLIQNMEYVFRLRASLDIRTSDFDQEVMVMPGQPPTMDLKCVFNCMEKLNPLQRLVMESNCTDCNARSRRMLGYWWRLYKLGEDGRSWEIVEGWEQNATTGISSMNLAINSHFFEYGGQYRLRVNAWKPGGYPGGFVQYSFNVNTPPTNGSCAVSPNEGFALETRFFVECDGWVDEDGPLLYFLELENGEDVIPLGNSYDTKMSAVFPLGHEEYDYVMTVSVLVMDSMLLTSSVEFYVKVTKPAEVNLDAATGDLDSALSNGNPEAASQMTNAVSSVLNAKSPGVEDEAAKREKEKVRAKMASAMATQEPGSFDDVSQSGEAFNALTQSPDEVTPDTQGTATKAIGKMAGFLGSSDTSRTMDNTAKSLFSGLGNVVNAATKSINSTRNGTSAQNETESDEPAGAASMNATRDSLNVVDQVGTAFMKQMVAGDKPKAIKTGNMDLALARKSLDDMDNDDDDDDGESFRLPNAMSLFAANSSDDDQPKTIDSTMTAMNDNPFAWDDSASDVSSKVVGLSLTDGNGNPLDLSGSDVEAFVPRDLDKNPVDPPDMHSFSEDDGAMRVHRFNRTSNFTAIGIEARPVDENMKLLLLVRYGQRPSAQHYDWNFTTASIAESRTMRKLPDPFSFILSMDILTSNMTEENGEFFLGVKVANMKELRSMYGENPLTNYTLRIYQPKCMTWNDELSKWSSDGCRPGPKTTIGKTHCICRPAPPEDEELTEDEQEVLEAVENAAAAGSLHNTSILPTAAAQFGEPTTTIIRKKRVKRKPVSRVSFGGGLFPAPNPIDFSKVFNVSLLDNPVAFAAVMSFLFVYLVLAVWARREDLKDVQRAGVTPLEDNDPYDEAQYEITVHTGFGSGADTTSRVFFTLTGDDGESEPRELKDPKRKTFQRRGVDIFLATFPESLGDVTHLHIWHSNEGKSASWFLSRVQVEDTVNNKKYLFICDSWLDVVRGDGTVNRLIQVAGKDEMTSFNHLFYSTTQKNLSDNHLWFSIFIRPAKSRFTRLQRLTCALTLLYCSMIVNAMFYQVGGESDPSTAIHIGPLSISPSQIGIGIISSLIIVPVNMFIVTAFRCAGPKPSEDEMRRRKKRKNWLFYEIFYCIKHPMDGQTDYMDMIQSQGEKDKQKDEFLNFSNSRSNLVVNEQCNMDAGMEADDGISFRLNKFEKEKTPAEIKKEKKKKKKKKEMPYWFVYIAWVVSFVACFLCAFFVVLYGFQFGKEKSAQWITSMLVAFFQDALISQPIKILAIAVVLSAIIKKPQEEEDEDDNKKKKGDEEWLHERAKDSRPARDKPRPPTIIRFKPPDEEKLKAARELRLKEIEMKKIIKEVLVYLFFMTSLSIVCYTHKDVNSYNQLKSMEDIFIEKVYGGDKTFEQIGDKESLWAYLRTTLLNGVFTSKWYNDDSFEETGFAADKLSFVIGQARIRQIRVKPQSCRVADEFKDIIEDCNDFYSWSEEDVDQHDVAWIPLKNESLYDPPFTFKSWEYYTALELDTIPLMGILTTYGGGGFTAELGEDRKEAEKTLDTLYDNRWIDANTRAVFIELTTYNPHMNLFSMVTLLLEFLPTNGLLHFHTISVCRLFSTGGSTTLVTVSQIFIVIFFLQFIYEEFKELRKKKRAYFKEFWNCIEFALIIMVFSAVILYFSRSAMVVWAMRKLENSPSKFISFMRMASADSAFGYVSGFLVFTTWIKAIKLLRFNKRIGMVAATLKLAGPPLLCFSLVFFVFFMAYVQFAFLVFGPALDDYYNFVAAMEASLGILLGSFDFEALTENQVVLGPLFFFTFMLSGNFILINMFLTIIMDCFAEVKEDVDKQGNEYEIVEFMLGRFQKFAGMGRNRIDNLTKEEAKAMTKTEVTDLRPTRRRNRFKRPAVVDSIAARFRRLDNSVSRYCYDDWTEDQMFDELLQMQYTVDPEMDEFNPSDRLEREEEEKTMRDDLYAAADHYQQLSPRADIQDLDSDQEDMNNEMLSSLKYFRM